MAGLAGVRVLALDHYYAGNFGSQLLSRLGAEVIKIEIPPDGDPQRQSGPIVETSAGPFGLSEIRVMLGKKSVAIDVSKEEGGALFLDLVGKSDIVWTNLKPSSLKKRSLTFDRFKEVNPSIIYTSLSGFGHDDLARSGPMGDWPALDIIPQGLAGLQFRTEGASDKPLHNGLPVAGQLASIQAVFATLLALYRRAKDKSAQRIDIAMHDVMLFLNEASLTTAHHTGTLPDRGHSPEQPQSEWVPAKDGYVTIITEGLSWYELAHTVIGPTAVSINREVPAQAQEDIDDRCKAAFLDWCSRSRCAEIAAKLKEGSVAAAQVLTLPEVLESAQAYARNMIWEFPAGAAKTCRFIGNPLKMDGLKDSVQGTIPSVGEHTREILSSVLGLPSAQIDELRARGTFGDAVAASEGASNA